MIPYGQHTHLSNGLEIEPRQDDLGIVKETDDRYFVVWGTRLDGEPLAGWAPKDDVGRKLVREWEIADESLKSWLLSSIRRDIEEKGATTAVEMMDIIRRHFHKQREAPGINEEGWMSGFVYLDGPPNDIDAVVSDAK